MKSVGLRSLAVSFPAEVRHNDYWRENFPEAVADAERRSMARLFSATPARAIQHPFDIEMAPYVADPFRGAVERRVLSDGQTALDIELAAAGHALDAAGMSGHELDAVMVASMIPDMVGLGNAAFLTRAMGLTIPAWNIESACCGAVVALQNATALVRGGEYRSVLVAVSSANSRVLDDEDSLSWFMADGAGAFVVGEVEPSEGVLGTKVIGTQETCGAFVFEPVAAADGSTRIRLRAGEESAGQRMRDRAEPQLRTCVDGALAAAGVGLGDIDFFVFNTPVRWFAPFCARALGIDPGRTVNMFQAYGNLGPALTTANLYHAARSGKIRKGDLVLVFAVGSVSTAGATVMRWGDVGLGPLPRSCP